MAKQRAAKPPRIDRGATGPAMLAREVVELATIEAGVSVRVLTDADPLTAMQLSRRQADAADYLRALWADALPAVEMPGSYGTGAGHGGARLMTHDQMLAAGRAWQDYRGAMDHLARYAGGRAHDAVRAAVVRLEPAHPPAVRDGLDVLAAHWRMR